jgi:transposase
LSWPLPEGIDDDALERRLFTMEPPAPSRPMPDWPSVDKELRKKGVTLMLLWLEYREIHPDGYAYSQFCVHYRNWHRRLDVVMRQHHRAGEKLFVDFPGIGIPIHDPDTFEVAFVAELFVAVLGASNYLFAEALPSQQLAHFIAGHVHAFEFFGGCPEIVVPDNLKSGVTRPHRYEPDVNATFQDMAAHYGVTVIPARSYKPRDKAKVESGVLLAERWIIARLRHHRFESLAAANAEIARLVTVLNDRPFKKLDGSRSSRFEEIDRPALRGLPAERYELATFKAAKVNIDYHVEFDRHYYSVPYVLVGEAVDLRVTASVVEVFSRGRRVASHVRSSPGGFTTDPAHMPESHRRHAQWTPSRVVAWAEATGPSTATLVGEAMARRPHPEQGFRSCLGIIRLGKRHGAGRLEAACARALSAHAYSYKSVESILKLGLDAKPLAGSEKTRSHPDHDNVRGADYYR